MTQRIQMRQGDVLIDYDNQRDNVRGFTQVPRENGRVILALGESTTHAHAIVDDDATLYEAPRQFERRLRIVRKPVAFVHEEHRKIALPPGLPRVRRQREYHPSSTRTVAD